MNDRPACDSIVPLHKGDLRRAAEMMARAFFDDPFMHYMIPDPRKRSRPAPWFSSTGMLATPFRLGLAESGPDFRQSL